MVLKRRSRELIAYPDDAHLGDFECPHPLRLQAEPRPRQRFVCLGPDGVVVLELWRPVDLLAETVIPGPARHLALLEAALSPPEIASMCI